jgi:hypothetical protein
MPEKDDAKHQNWKKPVTEGISRPPAGDFERDEARNYEFCIKHGIPFSAGTRCPLCAQLPA